jgi:hypothetical protein
LGGRFVYEVKVLLGYQRIFNPKKSKHLKEGKVKGNKGFCEGGRWRCAS